MNYWLVNQNRTFDQEFQGSYIWSPKRTTRARNPFYEFMREVVPGDIIFSYRETHIVALGIARSYCYESPKPVEFGQDGDAWENIGWKVDVQFTMLDNTVRPKSHMREILPHLPPKYAPLLENGQVLQQAYLARVPRQLAQIFFRLIGPEVNQVRDVALVSAERGPSELWRETSLQEWESRIESTIQADARLNETERKALVFARRGQGLFRDNVRRFEKACRVTKVEKLEHLIASHIKPWRDASNEERLDGENGLLLTPSVDHLFDRGFISFENDGKLIVSPVADTDSLRKMGILHRESHFQPFSHGQRQFLDYHRDNILRQASVTTSDAHPDTD